MNIDSLINNAAENSIVNVPPGVHTVSGSDGYEKPGGTVLKRGVQLMGVPGLTHIILTPKPTGDLTAIYGPFGANVVSGINVILPNAEKGRKFNGIYLGNPFEPKGTGYNVIEKCVVDNVSGDKAYERESFGISCMGVEARIRGCRVTIEQGSYTTGIVIQAGIVSTSTIQFPVPPVDGWGKLVWQGFGTADLSGGLYPTTFENVTVINALTGFYVDTGSLTGEVKDCTFVNVECAALLNFEVSARSVPRLAKDWSFHHNRLFLRQEGTHCLGVTLGNLNSTGNPARANECAITGIRIYSNQVNLLDPHITKRVRRLVSLVSHCDAANETTPCGITNVLIENNELPVIPEDQGPFVLRNMGGRAKNIRGSILRPLTFDLA